MPKTKLKKHKTKITKDKIYEYNPDSKVIRWRYIGESIDKFGWPNYGRILKEKKSKKNVSKTYK